MATRNIAVAQRVIEEAWNKGNLAVIDELYSPGVVSHEPAALPDEQGLEGRKRAVQRYRNALPELAMDAYQAHDFYDSIQSLLIEGQWRIVSKLFHAEPQTK